MMQEEMSTPEPLQNDDDNTLCLLLLAASRIPHSSVPPYPASQMACIGQTQRTVPALERTLVAGSYLTYTDGRAAWTAAVEFRQTKAYSENDFKGKIWTAGLCTDIERYNLQMTSLA